MVAGMMQANPDIGQAFENIPELKPVFGRFMERQRKLAMDDLRGSLPRLIEAYATAYARNFTSEELVEIRLFFETPTGRKYAQRSASLMSDPDIALWQRDISAAAESRKEQEVKMLMDEVMPISRASARKEHGS